VNSELQVTRPGSDLTASSQGRVVIVTGGGAGIGEAICRVLAERGWRVAVTDIDGAAAGRVAESIGGVAAQLDVTDVASIAHAADEAEARLGPIDAWVANAGVSSMAPFTEISEIEWDRNIDVNAKGVFLTGQEAARRFIARGRGGVIVNTASMAGKRGAAPFLAHYVASKFAVVGLTQAMAAELAPAGIRVNCVCPGYVVTAMQERELAWEAALRGSTAEHVRELYIADTPLRRLETPEDVAVVVAFLLGPDSAFITGEAVAVNGGSFMD
jgi:meso-butanediol dehydrogenase / (S,S)-butanediol dehydrogenase / diacetyl reductase